MKTKYRAVLLTSVTFEATSIEDAELRIDNDINLRELLEKNGYKIERSMTDIYVVGPAKE